MPETPRWWNASVVLAVAILAVGVLALIALVFAGAELLHLQHVMAEPD